VLRCSHLLDRAYFQNLSPGRTEYHNSGGKIDTRSGTRAIPHLFRRGRLARSLFPLCELHYADDPRHDSLDARFDKHRLSAEDDERVAGRAQARTERLVAHLRHQARIFNLYPDQMSGGQQQLVSIMRHLWWNRKSCFSTSHFLHSDYEMTLFMREQLQKLFMESGTTMVLVSHDSKKRFILPTMCCCCPRIRRGSPISLL